MFRITLSPVLSAYESMRMTGFFLPAATCQSVFQAACLLSKLSPWRLGWMWVWFSAVEPQYGTKYFSLQSLRSCISLHCGAPVNTLPSAGWSGKRSQLLPRLIKFLSVAVPVWLIIFCCSKSSCCPSSFFFPCSTPYVLLKKSKYTSVKSTPRCRGQQSNRRRDFYFSQFLFLCNTDSIWCPIWGFSGGYSEHTVGSGPTLD